MPTNLTKTQIITGIAIVLMVICAFFYSPLSPEPAIGDLFLLAGMVTFFVALHWHHSANPNSENTDAISAPELPFLWWHISGGLLCLILMAEGGSSPLQSNISNIRGMSWGAQFGLFVVGATLLAMGLSGVAWRMRIIRFRPTHILPVLPLLLIMLVGFILRVWNLENAVHYLVDEGHFVDAIIRLWDDPNTPILGPMNYIASFTYMQAVPQAISVDIFGANLVGLRMVSVIIGTLTIPAVYLLAKALFDRPVALISALLLATFPPHIHFSRLAMNNITDPLFGVLALAFLARGLKTGGRMNFALAGVCLGMTQYFYEGGKFVFPAVIVIWLIGVIIRRILERMGVFNEGALPRLRLRHGLPIFLFATVVIMLPQIYVLNTWDIDYATRLDDEGLDIQYWQDLLINDNNEIVLTPYIRQQLSPALLHYIQRPDDSHFYYAGHTALILPLLVPAFLLGIVHILWRRRISEWSLLLVLLLTTFGNSLLTYPDWTARFVVTFPILVIIIALGLSYTWRMLKLETFRSWMRYMPIVALIAVALIQVVYYFGAHLPVYNEQVRGNYDMQDVAWRSRELPPDTPIYIFSGDRIHIISHFITMSAYWDMSFNVVVYDPEIFSVDDLPDDVDIALYVQPDDEEILTILRSHFDLPEAQFSPYNVPESLQYALYYIEHGG